MNTIKKISILFCLIINISSSLKGLDDDTFMDELDNPTLIESHVQKEHEENPSIDILRITPTELNLFLDILVNAGIPGLLSKDFYRGTNPVQIRSLLDLPSTGLDLSINDDNCGQINISGFYNQTNKMHFRCNSPFIKSYLAFTNPDLLEEIDILEFTDLSIPDVLDLFQTIKLEERRAGFMINYNRRWSTPHGHDFTFGVNTPLYYLEHNFFLTEDEQVAISEAPFLEQSGGSSTSQDDAVTFGFQHLVSDQIGFGDTRLTGYFALTDTEKQYATLGGVVTIPTAFPIMKHVFGGKYNKCCPRPTLSLLEAATIYFSDLPNAQQLLTDMFVNYGIRILHQLTANLCFTSLGNNHHVTFGPRFEYRYKVCPWFGLNLYSDIQYFCPAHEKRFFVPIKNPADFTESARDYSNEDLAEENLNFLSTQLKDFFFPYVINTKVSPGFLVNLSTSMLFKTKRTNMELGYNFWRQSTEHLKLDCPCDLGVVLNVSKAIKQSAYQNKFFGRCMLKLPKRCGGLHLGFYGDVTFNSRNIGKDFTGAINLEMYY